MGTVTTVKPFVLFDKSTKKHLVVQYIANRRQSQIDIRWHKQEDNGELIPIDDGIRLPLALVSQVLAAYLTLGDGDSILLDEEAKEPLVVQYIIYRGEPQLDIRHHYWNAPGDLKPGQRGVSLSRLSYFARRVMEAVQDLVNEVA